MILKIRVISHKEGQDSVDPKQPTGEMTVFEGQASVDPKQPPGEMTVFVQNLLQQMQTRFKSMSDNIVSKNEMGNRINDLDQSINQLRAEIGPDGGSSSSALQKPEEEKRFSETTNA